MGDSTSKYNFASLPEDIAEDILYMASYPKDNCIEVHHTR